MIKIQKRRCEDAVPLPINSSVVGQEHPCSAVRRCQPKNHLSSYKIFMLTRIEIRITRPATLSNLAGAIRSTDLPSSSFGWNVIDTARGGFLNVAGMETLTTNTSAPSLVWRQLSQHFESCVIGLLDRMCSGPPRSGGQAVVVQNPMRQTRLGSSGALQATGTCHRIPLVHETP